MEDPRVLLAILLPNENLYLDFKDDTIRKENI